MKTTTRSKSVSTERFAQKRSDTRVGSIEKQYKVDFGVRSDMELSSYLKKSGYPSLSKVIKKLATK